MKHTRTLLFLLTLSCLVIFAGCGKSPEPAEADYSALQNYLAGLYEDETAYTVKSLDGENMTQQFLDDTKVDAQKGDWKKIDAYCRENVSLIRAADQPETKTEGNTVSLEQSLRYLAVARDETSEKKPDEYLLTFDVSASMVYDKETFNISQRGSGVDHIFIPGPNVTLDEFSCHNDFNYNNSSVLVQTTVRTKLRSQNGETTLLSPILDTYSFPID